jgi:drug/metabolite transporter (DMT)-like permease
VVYLYDLHYLFSAQTLRITIGSLSGALGLFCMLLAIKNVSLQWLGIYNLIGIVFTSIYLFFFENVNLINSLTGIIIIGTGFIFFILTSKQNNNPIYFKNHLQLALMTIAFNTAGILHWKSLNDSIPPLLVMTNQETIVFLVSSLVFYFNKEKKFTITKEIKMHFKKVSLMAFVIFLAIFSSLFGLKETNPVISGVLFLAVPILTITLSTIIFKEQFTFKNGLAIAIISVGVIILHSKI